jgi:hypothetical protein
MARTKAKSVKPKFSAEVAEIFSQLKSNDVKLSMLKEATLVKKLSSKHNIKPVVIQKQTKMSLPHVYNLVRLASMSPRMRAYVMSGKIGGTEALNILRKAKDEKDFIRLADEIAGSKIDRRLKENRNATVDKKKDESTPTGETKRGRGRPRKEKTVDTVQETPKRKAGRPRKEKVETPVTPDNISARKEKIKNLILNFLGKKVTKVKNKSLNLLVEELIANN